MPSRFISFLLSLRIINSFHKYTKTNLAVMVHIYKDKEMNADNSMDAYFIILHIF